MEKVLLKVPGMWADHHVTNVVTVLRALQGVSAVETRAMSREVEVTFDPKEIQVSALHAALENAGYPAEK